MQSNAQALPITEQQLTQQTQRANAFINSTKWTPAPPPASAQGGGRDNALYKFRLPTPTGQPQQQEISILKVAQNIGTDSLLIAQDINYVLHCLRQGLRIGFHLSALYAKSSGLEVLVQQNKPGIGLSDTQQTEFRAKQVTTAAVAVFTIAQFITWQLDQYKASEVGTINIDFAGIPELALRNPIEATGCMLYYYAAYIEKSGVVHTPLDFVKMTLLYFHGIIDEIKLRQGSLQYAETFTQNIYKLEESEFLVNGFELLRNGGQVSIEFKRVSFDDIVGNRDAKHKAQRLAERLICYDPLIKKNIFLELGGLTTLRMGRGKPGTGKSMQIAATATLIAQYCEMLDIPFLFWPLPDAIVSTFQGGSAKNMADWFLPLRDPNKIIYATIDDAENNLQERTRQGASEGERGLIGVFLRNTEGAYAINHGNWAMDLFTNIPDQVDRAVFSRVQDRLDINGAETWEDYLDQDHKWIEKYQKIDPRFVNMKDPHKYVYMSAQKRITSLSDIYEGKIEPTEEKIREIYEVSRRQYNVNEHAFFAQFFLEVQKEYPFFSSRDVRNIQTAVDTRVTDFDLPSEWLERPELFYKKNHEDKRVMVLDLMKTHMKNLSFAEIRLQETIRYVETTVRIMDTGKERRTEELVEQMLIQQEAAERVTNRLPT